MASVRVELCQVLEELEDLEQQLEQLLERQQQLLGRQRRLQQILAQETKEKDKGADGGKGGDGGFNKTDFPWSADLSSKLSSVFGISVLRPLQLETMNTTLSGRDCVLVMPTGGGKSLCFQLPALVSQGITLVVSPLISLMEDQLFSLHKLGVSSRLLNAASTKEEVNWVHAAMTDRGAELKILYVTPEKLAKSKRFMNKLEKMHEAGRFSRLVIDEVHCCSQWGHDFRPDYKFLGIMKKQFAGVPILGLTATATSTVMEDVKKILNIRECLVYRASFNRENLFYEVRQKPSGLQVSVDDMSSLIKSRFRGQSGIVYCFSQKDTEDVARELTSRGLAASCYHANLNPKYRSQVHSEWIANKIQVVVATIAFGMGIDKPDVRFVIHHSLSKSMENYYQESGRAGRDSLPAHCVLYVSFQDVFRQSCLVFTEQTGLEKLHGMVHYGYSLDRCRRSLIARHFGENWRESECHGMCDHCDPNNTGDVEVREVSGHCRAVVTTLHKHRGKTRLTGLKLMDAWLGKGKNSLLSRHDAERLLIHMLLEGYIREDFHFTAYTTISYLVTGPREHMLQRPDHTVNVPYKVKSTTAATKSQLSKTLSKTSLKSTKSAETTSNALSQSTDSIDSDSIGSFKSSKHSKTSSNASQKSAKSEATLSNSLSKSNKRVPCVINDNHSKVTSSQFTSESPNITHLDFLENGLTGKPKKTKKRRVIISDESDSDLDFGETLVSLKKSRKSRQNNQKGAICVDKKESNRLEDSQKLENGRELSTETEGGCITLDSD